MPVKKRDPSDPDFPHGTRTGYEAGCRKNFPCPSDPSCRALYADLRTRRAKKDGDGVRRYKAHTLRAYVQTWLNQDWQLQACTDAAGWTKSQMIELMQGRTTYCAEDKARAIMLIDEDKLLDAARNIPVRYVRWKFGSLAANGWALQTQADQLGYSVSMISDVVAGKLRYVSREFYEDVEFFFEGACTVPGTSLRARNLAARHGFRLPHEYAPDGTLWDEVEGRNEKHAERWERRSRLATERLRTLQLAVQGVTLSDSAARLGINERTVSRHRAEAQLVYESLGRNGKELAKGQDKRIAEILAVLSEWETDPGDPYVYCRRLGMMQDEQWAELELLGKPKLVAA